LILQQRGVRKLLHHCAKNPERGKFSPPTSVSKLNFGASFNSVDAGVMFPLARHLSLWETCLHIRPSLFSLVAGRTIALEKVG
jgi:hypothetical protein